MDILFDPQFWNGLWQIVVVNILLSGDNAVVIALACRNLPDRYRNPAIFAGSAGAVVIRIVFCLIIAWLLEIPAIKLVGGLLLLWIGVKLMVPEDEEDGDGVKGAGNLWGAIQTIIIADVVMSLDNVIAIVAAAKGDIVLIVIGIVMSVPLIVFGSPASSMPMRAKFMPCSASGMAQPTMMSSMRVRSSCGSGSRMPRRACASRSSGRVFLNTPRGALPTGVRLAATM